MGDMGKTGKMAEVEDFLGVNLSEYTSSDGEDYGEDYEYGEGGEDYADTLGALTSLVGSVALGTGPSQEVNDSAGYDYMTSDDEEEYEDFYTEPEVVIVDNAPVPGVNIVETSVRPEEKREVVDPERWQTGKGVYKYTPKPQAQVVESAPSTKLATIIPVGQKTKGVPQPAPKPVAVKPPSTLDEALVQGTDEPDVDFVVRMYYSKMTASYAGTDVPTSVLLGRYFLRKVKNGVEYEHEIEEYLKKINDLIKSSAKPSK